MAEEPEEASESGAKPVPANPFRYLSLVLLILLLEAAGGYLVLDWVLPPQEDVAKEDKKGDEAKLVQVEEDPLYYEAFKELVVTPAPAQMGYLVQVSLALEVFPPAVIDELTTRHEVIQDLVLQTLEAFPVEAFQDAVKTPIKEGLRQALNKELKNGEVRAVYFVDFVMQ